jgi:hypothetical protein
MGYLHLPYQTNIQSLWENLAHQIIYFLPSKTFLYTILFEQWYYWEEKFLKPIDMIIKSVELSEWYQQEPLDMFVYFDSWQDLTIKYHYYIENNEELLEKKRKIQDYVIKSNHIQIEKWKNIFENLTYSTHSESIIHVI